MFRSKLSPVIVGLVTILISTLAVAPQADAAKSKFYVAKMVKAHLPAAPNNGTDDYRCFLLDPKVTEDSVIKSVEFVPQKKNYVHHAIMFRVTQADVAEAVAADKNGKGWPCFGGSGLGSMFSSFLTSPWLSSWAPGRGKDVSPKGYGIPFKKGEKLVLQVHYNLLAAHHGKLQTDQSKIIIEAIPAKGATVKQLQVELFPAPVELACPAGVTGPLCDRKASLIDLAARTSTTSAFEATGINALCGQNPFKPISSTTSRCDKVINKSFNVIAAAPHMHLLGVSFKAYGLSPAGDTIRLISIPKWDFRWQYFYTFEKTSPIIGIGRRR